MVYGKMYARSLLVANEATGRVQYEPVEYSHILPFNQYMYLYNDMFTY